MRRVCEGDQPPESRWPCSPRPRDEPRNQPSLHARSRIDPYAEFESVVRDSGVPIGFRDVQEVSVRAGLGHPETYEIRVRGRLDERWADWLGGVTIAVEDTSGGAVTRLCGQLDQTALRGVVNRLWDLNLTVLSVTLAALPRSAGAAGSP